jgi:glycosyltransferase involved in cell wall biosynthesis
MWKRTPLHVPEPRPRILYFARIDFPSPKANSIQTVNTCYELARQGADVLLVVRRLLKSRRDCFAWYGLPEHPRLRFLSMSLPTPSAFNDWDGPYFRFYLASLLRRHRRRDTVVMTRDPAGLDLLRTFFRLRPHPELRTVFEIHKLAFLTKASHQKERGRSLQDDAVRDKIERRRALEADIYAGVDGLVCTSENARRLLEQHFAPHCPVAVVPNGTRIPAGADGAPHVVSGLDDRGRDLEVVYVGQLYRWKGIDGLVRAMAHLPGRRLTIVGGSEPADVERLQALARAEGVAERIDFVGYVTPPEVEAYLARARVGVIPLPHEGFVEAAWFTSPLKAFELMRAGVPVVASDLPSMRELVRAGEHALLVPPDDPPALAAGIDRLLRDRVLAAELVARAATHVLDYSWEARARRLLEFLNGLQPQAQARGA